MWFHDIARDHANKNAQAGNPQNQITYEMLTGSRQFDTIEAQIQCPRLLHEQLKTVALEAWDQITPQGEPTSSYTKILQGPNESYADFFARLETDISCTVIGEEAKRQLERLLAYENANQECQRAITPIHETRAIIDYLKACHNLGSETQKMQMLVEAIAATFGKGNEGCFICGDKNHLKRDCSKKANKIPKICPRCRRGMHWAKNCKFKFDIDGKPIPGNSKQGTHQVPYNKNQGQILSFPSNPQHPSVLPSISQP